MAKKHHPLRVVLIVSLSLIVALGATFLGYAGIYYHAEDVTSFLQSDETVEVQQEGQRITFIPKRAKAGLVFYPGAKVEFSAYSGLCHALSQVGLYVILLHMPFNLAFLGTGEAQGIPSSLPEVGDWYLAGHSLGGAMAASFIAGDLAEWKGLILFAAYSTSNLADTALKTMTIYGSEDRVLNLEKYQANLANLPATNLEVVIAGGNHGGFGNYGTQKGDGEAGISPETQQALAAQALLHFVS